MTGIRAGTPAEGRLRRLMRLQRSEYGYSQGDAAGRAGMSKSRWRQIEKGGAAPADTLARMLEILGISPETAHQLGEPAVAKALQLRVELLGTVRPAWIADDTEAHLWDAPRTTEAERRHLIMTIRVLRADPRLAGDPGLQATAKAQLAGERRRTALRRDLAAEQRALARLPQVLDGKGQAHNGNGSARLATVVHCARDREPPRPPDRGP